MSESFIQMKKDGDIIDVNLLCVEDHKKLGWLIVDKTSKDSEPADDETRAQKKAREKAEREAEKLAEQQEKDSEPADDEMKG